MMKSRKQRKLEAIQNNEVFVPQYNGTGVLSFEDYYGVGNERFSNKFVTFDRKAEEVVDITEAVQAKEEEKIELIEPKLVKEAPKKKKSGKLKKAMKKLFDK